MRQDHLLTKAGQSYDLIVQEITTYKKIPDMIQLFEITC